MTKEDFDALLMDGVRDVDGTRFERGPLVYPKPPNPESASNGKAIADIYKDQGLCVCANWSFFKVRDAHQCLCHDDFKAKSSMRIEIFAPRLLTLLRERHNLTSAFELNAEDILVVLLNPTACPFADMGKHPSAELQLRLSCALAVMERARVNGEVPDLADALRRVGHLGEELGAWGAFASGGVADVPTLECLEWEHFEYRYHTDEAAELDRARASLFKAVRKHPKWNDTEKNTWAGRLQLSCMT